MPLLPPRGGAVTEHRALTIQDELIRYTALTVARPVEYDPADEFRLADPCPGRIYRAGRSYVPGLGIYAPCPAHGMAPAAALHVERIDDLGWPSRDTHPGPVRNWLACQCGLRLAMPNDDWLGLPIDAPGAELTVEVPFGDFTRSRAAAENGWTIFGSQVTYRPMAIGAARRAVVALAAAGEARELRGARMNVEPLGEIVVSSGGEAMAQVLLRGDLAAVDPAPVRRIRLLVSLNTGTLTSGRERDPGTAPQEDTMTSPALTATAVETAQAERATLRDMEVVDRLMARAMNLIGEGDTELAQRYLEAARGEVSARMATALTTQPYADVLAADAATRVRQIIGQVEPDTELTVPLKHTNGTAVSRVLREAGYRPLPGGSANRGRNGLIVHGGGRSARVSFSHGLPRRRDELINEIRDLLTGKGYVLGANYGDDQAEFTAFSVLGKRP